MPNPPNKIKWTNKMICFLKDNYETMTNKQLADSLGLKLKTTRTKLYELGLKRMELVYWTEEQINFLKANYKTMGDTEIAEIFEKKYNKDKGWSNKHIEKKRRYLGLKRTPQEINVIKKKNIEAGRFAICVIKMWEKRGITPEGTIKFRRYKNNDKEYAVIKTDGKFIHWNRWAWEKKYGKIPDNMNVIFKDGNHHNLSLDNLELIDNNELARRNCHKAILNLTDNYIAGILSFGQPELRKNILNHPEIIQLKRAQLKLRREIEND